MPTSTDKATGVFCLETGTWWNDFSSAWNVRPILELVEACSENFHFIYKDVNTRAEFEYLLQQWTTAKYSGYSVGYFAFHGNPGCITVGESEEDNVSLEELSNLLKGKCEGRIIHVSSCAVFDVPDAQLRSFQSETNAKCIVGYTKDVDWLPGALMDIALLEALHRFKRLSDAERRLYKDYGFLAEKLGLRLIH